MDRRPDVVMVGGGLAGLSAAALLARGGWGVTVIEKASALGGRAATQEKGGFRMNLGAHALYLGGAARRVLDGLGVEAPGRSPLPSGGLALKGGTLHTLPAGLVSLLTTGVVDLSGKIEIARIFATLPRVDTGALAAVTVRAWLDGAVRVPSARGVLEMLLRISSYTADFDRLSAGAALRQLQIALSHNVRYVDGGWQTLVEGLRRVGEAAGVAFVSGARVEQVVVERGEVRGVRLAGGREIPAQAVVLAVSPGAAADLVPSAPELAAHAAAATPVRAACLDLGLSRLPVRRALAAFGVDRPLYLSVHSAAARLCPDGSALLHLAKYLGGPGGDGDPEQELEDLMDKVQPGWREVVVERRFLPSLAVMNDLADAGRGGLAGRPKIEVAAVRGLYLAGDWVGPEGMLADASLASASQVAQALGDARREGGRPRRGPHGLHEVAPS